MKRGFILLLALIGISGQARGQPTGQRVLLASTRQGPVRGIQLHEDVDAFLGVPYAQPPVGSLRFAPPHPPLNRSSDGQETTVFNATAFGPVCHQFHYKTILGAALVETSGQSEDCLTLNVFVPRQRSCKLLPVFVWSYGGAFGEGGGSMPLFNPTQFVIENKDIIVVTWK